MLGSPSGLHFPLGTQCSHIPSFPHGQVGPRDGVLANGLRVEVTLTTPPPGLAPQPPAEDPVEAGGQQSHGGGGQDVDSGLCPVPQQHWTLT